MMSDKFSDKFSDARVPEDRHDGQVRTGFGPSHDPLACAALKTAIEIRAGLDRLAAERRFCG